MTPDKDLLEERVVAKLAAVDISNWKKGSKNVFELKKDGWEVTVYSPEGTGTNKVYANELSVLSIVGDNTANGSANIIGEKASQFYSDLSMRHAEYVFQPVVKERERREQETYRILRTFLGE